MRTWKLVVYPAVIAVAFCLAFLPVAIILQACHGEWALLGLKLRQGCKGRHY